MDKISRKISFDNGRGQKLAGIIDAPAEGPPRAFGVFAPCFTCVKESHAAARICRALAARGFAMLRFDMTGLGGSAGDFADTNFTTRIADIVAACRSLDQPAQLLVGHSISGTAALSAARELPHLRLVATVGSPADPAAVIAKFRENGLIAEDGADIVIDVLGHPTRFRKSFLDDMLAQKVAEETAALKVPLMVFHGPKDAVVKYAQAEEIARRNPAAELVTLAPESTHLFEKGDADAAFIAEKIAATL